MNEEIEEMMLTVPQKIVAYDGRHAVQHLYREQRQEIAEAIYNAGYRKVGSDAKGNLLKILNLCIEFDEMGYEPTTLCENPEQTAKKWKSDLMYEIGLFLDEARGIKARYNELKAENERLKEQVEMQRNEKWDAQDDLDCYCDEMLTRINQAVQDFAGKIKDYINNKVEYEYGDMSDSVNYITIDIDEFETFIDNLLEEQNGKDKD